MKKIAVRCWKIEVHRSDIDNNFPLYITYPEDNSGHDLITCLNCGAIYAIDICKQVYIGPPLDDKLKGMNCSCCNKPLENSYAYYPETYLFSGNKYFYKRSLDIPPDEDSMVKEFEGIYG
jgi:hypothetical protein